VKFGTEDLNVMPLA